ncbi:hypothetical protein ElyMa_006981400 [Elysia marginata]|uniref:Uncharacterized protein n=1 Tax=Elysia marginata TaxID=1093978 RepID=A0AAV4JMT9_9GAST|nr:hypothetical protein ElyMa_006981400 [Elysia marginata]
MLPIAILPAGANRESAAWRVSQVSSSKPEGGSRHSVSRFRTLPVGLQRQSSSKPRESIRVWATPDETRKTDRLTVTSVNPAAQTERQDAGSRFSIVPLQVMSRAADNSFTMSARASSRKSNNTSRRSTNLMGTEHPVYYVTADGQLAQVVNKDQPTQDTDCMCEREKTTANKDTETEQTWSGRIKLNEKTDQATNTDEKDVSYKKETQAYGEDGDTRKYINKSRPNIERAPTRTLQISEENDGKRWMHRTEPFGEETQTVSSGDFKSPYSNQGPPCHVCPYNTRKAKNYHEDNATERLRDKAGRKDIVPPSELDYVLSSRAKDVRPSSAKGPYQKLTEAALKEFQFQQVQKYLAENGIVYYKPRLRSSSANFQNKEERGDKHTCCEASPEKVAETEPENSNVYMSRQKSFHQSVDINNDLSSSEEKETALYDRDRRNKSEKNAMNRSSQKKSARFSKENSFREIESLSDSQERERSLGEPEIQESVSKADTLAGSSTDPFEEWCRAKYCSRPCRDKTRPCSSQRSGKRSGDDPALGKQNPDRGSRIKPTIELSVRGSKDIENLHRFETPKYVLSRQDPTTESVGGLKTQDPSTATPSVKDERSDSDRVEFLSDTAALDARPHPGPGRDKERPEQIPNKTQQPRSADPIASSGPLNNRQTEGGVVEPTTTSTMQDSQPSPPPPPGDSSWDPVCKSSTGACKRPRSYFYRKYLLSKQTPRKPQRLKPVVPHRKLQKKLEPEPVEDQPEQEQDRDSVSTFQEHLNETAQSISKQPTQDASSKQNKKKPLRVRISSKDQTQMIYDWQLRSSPKQRRADLYKKYFKVRQAPGEESADADAEDNDMANNSSGNTITALTDKHKTTGLTLFSLQCSSITTNHSTLNVSIDGLEKNGIDSSLLSVTARHASPSSVPVHSVIFCFAYSPSF